MQSQARLYDIRGLHMFTLSLTIGDGDAGLIWRQQITSSQVATDGVWAVCCETVMASDNDRKITPIDDPTVSDAPSSRQDPIVKIDER